MSNQLHNRLESLKSEMKSYFDLVLKQVEMAKKACLDFDQNSITKIISNEKLVNELELKIDDECESILSLYNPMAKDLRYILAVYEINHELERISDISDSIADYLVLINKPFDLDLLNICDVDKMFDVAKKMYQKSISAFLNEDTESALSILEDDEKLNYFNAKAASSITDFLKKNNYRDIENSFFMFSIMRKIEKLGDHIKNIGEEIVFFVDSKNIKHQDKKRFEK